MPQILTARLGANFGGVLYEDDRHSQPLRSTILSAIKYNHWAKFRVRRPATKRQDQGKMLSSTGFEILSALSFEGCTAVVKMLTSQRRS